MMKTLKNCYPLISFFFVLLVFAVIFKLNNIYPFGTLSISWCDMNQQTIPLLCDFKDVLSGKSDFWLSLENAGGMNFYGVYFFNLSSPFTYLVAFFEKSEMALAVNLMVVLKLAMAGTTFAFWLKSEIKNASPIIVLLISVTYAFSGWAMMYYQILSWLDTAYVFPLLLIGLKKIGEDKSPALYVISLFLCVLFHFYLAWAVVLFVCLYGAVFLITHKEKRDLFAKKFIISSLISALMATIVLLPCFLQYLQSMRGGSIIQALSESGFFPPTQTSLPTFFCLLIFAPFIVDILRRKHFDYLDILFALTLIPVFIEPVAAAWQTYDYMSFPTRYGFITVALGLTLAVKGITNLTKQKGEERKQKEFIKLIISCVVVAFGVAFASFTTKYYHSFKEVLTNYSKTLWGNNESLSKLFVYYFIPFVFVAITYVVAHYKLVHKIAIYALIALLCISEAGFSSNVYMVAPANDYGSYQRALELENLIEDDDFYRLKLDGKYIDVNNVGAMGYNSLSHYTSLNRESYMLTAKQLGYSSYWMEVGTNGGTIFTDALVRHKYIVSYSSSNAKYKTEHFYVAENELLFPTAFIIEKDGKNQADSSLERWEIQDELFTRLTGTSGLYKEYLYSSSSNIQDISGSEESKAKTHLILQNNLDTGYLRYTINVTGTKSLYFDCFDEYSNSLREHTDGAIKSIVSRRNGVTVKRYYEFPTQSTNGIVYLGNYTDCTVTVEVGVKKDVYANSFGLFTIDNDLLESAVNGVIGGDFTVIKDKLYGKITAEKGKALFTSFAYDEGYRVKINGKKAQTFNLNGFLAIELQEGENNVIVDFLPRGFILSLVIFTIGVCSFVLYLIFEKKVNEKFRFLNKPCVYLTFALGVIVILMIYLMPVAVNLITYF